VVLRRVVGRVDEDRRRFKSLNYFFNNADSRLALEYLRIRQACQGQIALHELCANPDLGAPIRWVHAALATGENTESDLAFGPLKAEQSPETPEFYVVGVRPDSKNALE
jgi:hypothetical protein